MNDQVTSPAHYAAGGMEPIDYLKLKLTPEEFAGFCKGNVIKYLSRANHKNGEEDLKKAAFYARMLAGDDPRKDKDVGQGVRVIPMPPADNSTCHCRCLNANDLVT